MIALALALVTSAAPVLEPGAVVTVPPHVGVVFSPTDTVGVALFLPWVWRIPEEEGAIFRPNQLVLEPGVVFRAETSFTARAVVRWLRVAVSWLALGGGMGMGVEVGPKTRVFTSIELVARLGKGPRGFGLVSARADVRLDGSVAWMLALGATYW